MLEKEVEMIRRKGNVERGEVKCGGERKEEWKMRKV